MNLHYISSPPNRKGTSTKTPFWEKRKKLFIAAQYAMRDWNSVDKGTTVDQLQCKPKFPYVNLIFSEILMDK